MFLKNLLWKKMLWTSSTICAAIIFCLFSRDLFLPTLGVDKVKLTTETLPSFARQGYYCQFQGAFCMPASKTQTEKIVQLCGPSSDRPGFLKFGEKIVERTLAEMLGYEPGGAVLELGAQYSFLDMDVFHRDSEGSQIFTFQPDYIEFVNVESKYRSAPRVNVFHSAIFAEKKEKKVGIENGGGVSASYFETNKTFLASRKRKPAPRNSIYNSNEDHFPDNMLLSEALRLVKQKSNRHKISALVINCEGCEYSLINFLTENREDLATISTVVVQFHRSYIIPGIDSLTENYCELKMRLSRTHCLLWNFNYVWEAWVSHEYCI